METNQTKFNDDLIDAAVAAYNDLTPESIAAFRALSDLDAAVVVRVLQASNPAKPKRGRPEGSRNRPSKVNGAPAAITQAAS